NAETSFCCGAGGARMWMEETIGERIGTVRAAEAVATGASAIATACPFCTVMLKDGVAAHASAARGDADGTTPDGTGTRPAPGAGATGTQEPAGPRRTSDVPARDAVGVPEVADIAV